VSEPPKSRSNSRRPSLSDEKDVLVLQVRTSFTIIFYITLLTFGYEFILEALCAYLFSFASTICPKQNMKFHSVFHDVFSLCTMVYWLNV